MLRVVCSFVVVAAVLAAEEADACSFVGPSIHDSFLPFEGRELPLNAKLNVPNVGLVFERLPDGSEVELPVVSAVNDLTEQPVSLLFVIDLALTPGTHTLVVPDMRGERPPRDVTFTVLDEDDEEPPPPPVTSALHRTEGSLFRDVDACVGSNWPTDKVTFEIETDEPLVIIDPGRGVESQIARLNNKTSPLRITTTENSGGDVSYDVVAVDFAGNKSEPTIVKVWAGCEGGCASTSTALTPFGLLLLLLRRRRP